MLLQAGSSGPDGVSGSQLGLLLHIIDNIRMDILFHLVFLMTDHQKNFPGIEAGHRVDNPGPHGFPQDRMKYFNRFGFKAGPLSGGKNKSEQSVTHSH